jgi:hypothetical protein
MVTGRRVIFAKVKLFKEEVENESQHFTAGNDPLKMINIADL